MVPSFFLEIIMTTLNEIVKRANKDPREINLCIEAEGQHRESVCNGCKYRLYRASGGKCWSSLIEIDNTCCVVSFDPIEEE